MQIPAQMTYDQYCERIAVLVELVLDAMGEDDDAALLCVAAIIEHVMQHGADALHGQEREPVDPEKLREIKRVLLPIVAMIERHARSQPPLQ
jgi:hypothetical protein